ncbi:MAG: deoxyribonuclease IV [Candidatus Odinarchaeia archaeon]
MLIGYHVSIRDSLDKSVDRAVELGCTTFQIFTTNPRSWFSKNIKKEESQLFIQKRRQQNFNVVFSHMPYLPNLASPKIEVYRQSIAALISELRRCEILKIPYVVTHPGSHLGVGVQEGLNNIIKALNLALNEVQNSVKILLENTAGGGGNIGGSFKELRKILLNITQKHRIGVCLDTCHAFAAGYDLKTPTGIKKTIKEIDKLIGLENLKLIHLNDSVGEKGSKLDRHEHIGLGKIGIKGFKNLLSTITLDYPVILETPIDERRTDKENLRIVKQIIREIIT